jgi:hypothetical protein
MSRSTLTIKPRFKAYLDHAAKQAEAGATIRFDSVSDALAFLRKARVEDDSIFGEDDE